jgi:phenylacetate-coenzyme A ligase PaaK-like adenylate-forming protein
MGSQAEVHSIDALKDFRTALALYSEDTLSALGAVEAEVRRTVQWLYQERPYYSTTKERAKIRDRGTEPPPTGRRLPHHF